MIKFTAKTADDRTLLCMGLSHENLARIKNNFPIRFKGEDVGLPGQDIMIFAGKTEDAMAKQMAPYITAATVVKDSR